MLISVEKTNGFCCGLSVGHPLGNYFLQNNVQLWCPYFLIEGASTLLRHLKGITQGCFTNRTSNFQDVLGMQRGLGIT